MTLATPLVGELLLLALLAGRGRPALLYRRNRGMRERLAPARYSATTITVAGGHMRPPTVAALVGRDASRHVI